MFLLGWPSTVLVSEKRCRSEAWRRVRRGKLAQEGVGWEREGNGRRINTSRGKRKTFYLHRRAIFSETNPLKIHKRPKMTWVWKDGCV
jgi:hypothetical protein